MTNVEFWKAHGAGNDFLFTFAEDLTVPESQWPELAVAICDRHGGVGGDGWYVVERPGPDGADARIRLYNSDGSAAELSGNGTRCAAALLVHRSMAGESVVIRTGAGEVRLDLRNRRGPDYEFAMRLGIPRWTGDDGRCALPLEAGIREVTVLDVGNPQCAVAVDSLDFDWRTLGREIEGNRYFSSRTNVSFYRRAADDAIEARFYERGAGPTRSSGTGSCGAAVAAILGKLVRGPVRVLTEGGVLCVDWPDPAAPMALTGPASIVAQGRIFRSE